MNSFLINIRKRVAEQITTVIDSNAVNARLTAALKYTTLAPGKRIRPALVYATGELLQLPLELLDPIACALELIHCYSLIHDDLPAMDNDDLRRGRPTCHIQFDEATAILAGDALQALALNCVATLPIAQISPQQYQQILLQFTRAIGPAGLVAGQMFDIEYEGQSVELALLEQCHRLKTGVLIAAAINIPALMSNCTPEELNALQQLSAAIGVGFQIKDDILDAEQSSQELGKTANKDAAQNKFTYVTALGLAGAKAKLAEHLQQAQQALEIFSGHEVANLRMLVEFITQRGS